MTASHALQCRCGSLKGVVDHIESARRAICYCTDCQAFAHYLGKADTILDPMDGTGVIATLPANVRFTEGVQHLACMSLSPKGLLRWYASCCNTPIGNTPRNFRTSYVGLVGQCLGGPADIEQHFGPVRLYTNTRTAKGTPKKTSPLTAAVVIAGIVAALAGARLGGRYRTTPFFRDDGTPVVEPRVLSLDERAALMASR